MSTALVVYEHKFPSNRPHRPISPAAFYDRPGMLSGMLPATQPAMHPGADRSDRIVVERQAGTYGPDARIISTVSPGLIIDIHA